MFNRNNLPHELLLTARQKTRLRHAFENNMLTDFKLLRLQISRIIQSGGFLDSLLSKLAGPLNESNCSIGKKYFSPIRNNSCCFSNWCRNSKENKCFWNNNFNNFKRKNEWHNKKLFKLSKTLIFYRTELLKQLKN